MYAAVTNSAIIDVLSDTTYDVTYHVIIIASTISSSSAINKHAGVLNALKTAADDSATGDDVIGDVRMT